MEFKLRMYDERYYRQPMAADMDLVEAVDWLADSVRAHGSGGWLYAGTADALLRIAEMTFKGLLKWFEPTWRTKLIVPDTPERTGYGLLLLEVQNAEKQPFDLVGSFRWTETYDLAVEYARSFDTDAKVVLYPYNRHLATVHANRTVEWHDEEARQQALLDGMGTEQVLIESKFEVHTDWRLDYYASWREMVVDMLGRACENPTEALTVRHATSLESTLTILRIAHYRALRWEQNDARDRWLAEFPPNELVLMVQANQENPQYFYLPPAPVYETKAASMAARWKAAQAMADDLADTLQRPVFIISPQEGTWAVSHGTDAPLQWLSRIAEGMFREDVEMFEADELEAVLGDIQVTTSAATAVEVRWDNHETSTGGVRVTVSEQTVDIAFLSRGSGNWTHARQIPRAAWTSIVTALKEA